MRQPKLSVNQMAYQLVEKLCANPEKYGVSVKKAALGTTLIDAGINVKGGFLAGKIITEICLGGYGKAQLFWKHYGDLTLPSISISTDHPALATLGSQFAGWQIKAENYFAIGSGPARALALKPKEIYEKIGYHDKANLAIVVLETSSEPPNNVIQKLSEDCKVKPEHLFIVLTTTTSTTGSTQISGRIVETGIHKLMKLGLDPTTITYALGYAPIAPVHPKFANAMGRTNDAILYGGVVYYIVHYDNDKKLREFVRKAPSKVSKDYGKPFMEILKAANHDFYRIDPNVFAPAVLIVNNAKTGNVFTAGEINLSVLKQSFGLSS